MMSLVAVGRPLQTSLASEAANQKHEPFQCYQLSRSYDTLFTEGLENFLGYQSTEASRNGGGGASPTGLFQVGSFDSNLDEEEVGIRDRTGASLPLSVPHTPVLRRVYPHPHPHPHKLEQRRKKISCPEHAISYSNDDINTLVQESMPVGSRAHERAVHVNGFVLELSNSPHGPGHSAGSGSGCISPSASPSHMSNGSVHTNGVHSADDLSNVVVSSDSAELRLEPSENEESQQEVGDLKPVDENHLKLIHSSVLKTSKAKSPNKNVKFADTCGQQLSHVLSFESLDELDFTIYESPKNVFSPVAGLKTFAPLFFLPPNNDALILKTLDQKVKLESVHIVGTIILGSILVENIGFHKEVAIRYTTNRWVTTKEAHASYIQGSTYKNCDRFSFELIFEPREIEDRVIFCIRYKVNDSEFWDNNNNLNYTLKLLSS